MDASMAKDLMMSALKALLPIALMIGLQYIDFNEMGLLTPIQIVWAVSQAVSMFVLMSMKFSILKAKDKDEIVDLRDAATGKTDDITKTLTVSDYDRKELVKQLFQLCCITMISYFGHMKQGYTTPMVLQTVMSPYQVMDSNLARIYIRGMEPKGELKRPWANQFSGMGAKKEDQQDAKKDVKKSK